MQTAALSGGFHDPPAQSSRVFRALLTAMARPGTVTTVTGAQPPAPVSPAAGAVLLTLCDADTPVHLAGAADCAQVRQWLAFHCGASVAAAEAAQFAMGTWTDLHPLGRFALGTSEYPDRSATLIVDHHDFDRPPNELRGPGIRDVAHMPVPDPAFSARNAALFPLGLDLILTGGVRVAALPRTTRVD